MSFFYDSATRARPAVVDENEEEEYAASSEVDALLRELPPEEGMKTTSENNNRTTTTTTQEVNAKKKPRGYVLELIKGGGNNEDLRKAAIQFYEQVKSQNLVPDITLKGWQIEIDFVFNGVSNAIVPLCYYISPSNNKLHRNFPAAIETLRLVFDKSLAEIKQEEMKTLAASSSSSSVYALRKRSNSSSEYKDSPKIIPVNSLKKFHLALKSKMEKEEMKLKEKNKQEEEEEKAEGMGDGTVGPGLKKRKTSVDISGLLPPRYYAVDESGRKVKEK